MLSRSHHVENDLEIEGKPTNPEWGQAVTALINELYGESLDKRKLKVEIFGFSYPTEVLLILSISPKGEQANAEKLDHLSNLESCTSFFLSTDIAKESSTNEDLIKKSWNRLLDSAGFFMNQFLMKPEWDDYVSSYAPFGIKGEELYYKISRENIRLTLQANALLNQKS